MTSCNQLLVLKVMNGFLHVLNHIWMTIAFKTKVYIIILKVARTTVLESSPLISYKVRSYAIRIKKVEYDDYGMKQCHSISIYMYKVKRKDIINNNKLNDY